MYLDQKTAGFPEKDRPTGSVRRLLLALVLAGMVAAAFLLHGFLHAKLTDLPVTKLPREQIQITPTPEWLAVDVSGRVIKGQGDGDSPLSLARSNLVGELAKAFEASEWVDQVRVSKAYRRLDVELVYRKPVLCVPWKGKCCYVDASGTVLPPSEVKQEIFRDCFVALGLGEIDLPPVGKRFADSRVTAAGRLAAFLRAHKRKLGLLIIEVLSDPDKPFECDVTTTGDSRIVWARAGSRQQEDSNRGVYLLARDESKIQQLLDYQARHGSLELPHGPYRFDLTSATNSAPVRLNSSDGRPDKPGQRL